MSDAEPEPAPHLPFPGTSDAPGLELEVEHATRLCFAQQQAGLSLVRRVRIANPGTRPVAGARLVLELGRDLVEPVEVALGELPPGGRVVLEDLALEPSPERLRAQDERERVTLRARVERPREARELFDAPPAPEVLARHASPVDVLGYREWPGLSLRPELLAGFVRPNRPEVASLLREVAGLLERETGDPGLHGTAAGPARVRATLGAIHRALVGQELAYVVPPASFEQEGQKVRLVEDLVRERMGTCLDLVLLFASLMEQAGLHPLLVVVEGHALVGCWLTADRLPAVSEDGLALRKRVQLDEVWLLETTGVTGRPPMELEEARARGAAALTDLGRFRAVIDVAAAREQGVRPLPLGDGAADGPTPGAVLHVEGRLAGTVPGAGRAGAGGTDALGSAPVLPPPVPRADSAAPESRLERWRRRLLDLTLRNRLIAFRETHRTIPLDVPDLAALEDALARGAAFELDPRLELEDAADGGDAFAQGARRQERLGAAFARGRLHTTLGPEALEKRLVTTWREQRSALEETGAGTLHVTLGMLTWFEEGDPHTPRRAPIVLLPAELERRGVREGHRVRLGDGDPVLNVTLLEKLRTDFRIDDPALAEAVEDADGLDVPEILRRWRRAVRDRPGWEVREEAWLAHHAFAKFLLWRDLGERTAELERSPLVRHLVRTPEQAFRPERPLPEDGDLDRLPVQEWACPTDADSSQLAAVRAALEGHTFVLQGPPGTGKSQTITNLIAGALRRGQRVLFVAEKRAALEVVQRRLERIGLGPHVLELHSNKSSKRAVLEQLREALEAPRAVAPATWAARCEELEGLRAELGNSATVLHREHPLGCSLFEALGELGDLRDAAPVALDLPATATAAELAAARAALRAVPATVAEVQPLAGHSLTGVGLDDWTSELEDALRAAAADLGGAAQELRDRLRDAAQLLDLPLEADAPGAAGLERLQRAFEHVLAAPARPAALLCEPGWHERLPALRTWVERARDLRDARAALLAHWDPALLQADLDGLAAALRAGKERFLFLAWFACRAPRATLRGLRRGPLPTNDALLADLDEARRVRDEERAVSDPAGDGVRLLGADWARPERDLESAARDLEAADALRRALRDLGEDPLFPRAPDLAAALLALAGAERERLAPGSRGHGTLRAALAAHARLTAEREACIARLELDPDGLPQPEQDGYLPALCARAGGWSDAAPRLRPWTAWRRVRAELLEAGLSGPLQALERGELAPGSVERAFERAWREAFVRRTVDADPLLRNFRASDEARRAQRFDELDREVQGLVREVTRASLAERLPSARQASSEQSELGRLQRELRKKARHLPVRRLVAELPTLLPRLKPCFLMSPLSVAQYLDPALEAFDLVVFDEASQIPVWDAVGALARGREAVIVGDSRQLPPTTFFQRGADEEAPDEDDLDELESILDEAVAAQVPGRSLRWHYRSRHEDLITFSNVHYYDGGLFTFPAAGGAGPRRGVHHLAVPEGVYERGGKRWNRAEAEAVVREVLRRLREEPGRSLGVVTFSMAQQTLVEDLLEAELRADPALEAAFSAEREEPVFVKNLENVQGDERDVILFSVCYGPDPSGRVAMAFGPLNRDGGERRLNVAVTRAREEVLVVSTLRPEQIDLARTSALGAAHLKAYLEYAQRGPASLDANLLPRPGGRAASPFEDRVARALEAAGRPTRRAVGSSGYRVDVGLLDSRADDDGEPRFVLGVECDGATFREAPSVRDRERTRRAVLERLGWRLTRTWSLDWWLDPEDALERLLERADGDAGPGPDSDGPLPRTPSTPAPSVAAPSDGADPATPPDGAQDAPYTPARLRPRGDAEAFQRARTETLARALAEVVAAEAPVERELALRRTASAWGVTVLTRRVEQRLEEALATLLADPAGGVRRDADTLWRADQDPRTWLAWRAPDPALGEPRELDDVPRAERAGLLLGVLRHELGLPEEDLLRAGARAAGLGRLGGRATARLGEGLELLLERGLAQRGEDGRITLA